MRAARLLIVLVMVSAGLPALKSAAQETTASLGGKVADFAGLPLPGASLILKNQETGLLRTAFSSSGGRYLAPGLKPGVYEVTARLPGFVGQTRRNVVLELGSVAGLDFRLAPETLSRSEAVEVMAKPPLVETTQSQPAVVVNEAEIEGLPLNSRNSVREHQLIAADRSSARDDDGGQDKGRAAQRRGPPPEAAPFRDGLPELRLDPVEGARDDQKLTRQESQSDCHHQHAGAGSGQQDEPGGGDCESDDDGDDLSQGAPALLLAPVIAFEAVARLPALEKPPVPADLFESLHRVV